MEVIAGTALVALGGRVLAGRRSPGVWELWRLAMAITLSLITPPVAAPAMIGFGWLLSLGDRARRIGWDWFGIGCATLGRGILGPTRLPEQGFIVVALWLVGWASVRLPNASQSGGHGRFRWELTRATRALAPGTARDAWRIRASDALLRAVAAYRSVGKRRPGLPDASRGRALVTMCHGAAALADADGETARSAFATARRALISAAGDSPRRREELREWLEIIDWCTAAATLIDEEDPP